MRFFGRAERLAKREKFPLNVELPGSHPVSGKAWSILNVWRDGVLVNRIACIESFKRGDFEARWWVSGVGEAERLYERGSFGGVFCYSRVYTRAEWVPDAWGD